MIAEQLRKSILQAAIQGKLTEQLPEDGDARDLLKEIQEEKARLIKEGKIKKEKPLPEITDDEIPFDIPENWCWVRLGNMVINRDSERKPVSKGTRENLKKIYEYYGASGIIDRIDNYLFSEELLLVGEDGANLINRSTPIAFIARGKYWVNNHAHVLQMYSNISIEYMCYFVNAISLAQYVTGTAQPKMNQQKMNSILVAVPPEKGQIRIVNRLKELLLEIDKLEKDEIKLASLNKGFPPKMKNSILQYAIQGKLTEQLESDGDAHDLLKEIQKEKARLIKEGKIKREKPLPEITEDEIPFDIPENWCWVRLGEITDINPRNKINDEIPVSFMPMILLDEGFSNTFTYEERLWKDVKSGFTHFSNNDIVVAKITPCFQNRKSAVMRGLINDYGAGTTELHVIRPISNLVSSYYLLYLLKTEYFIYNGVLSMTGTAGQQRVGKTYVQNFIIPLPPFAEQQRIVERLNQLLPLCDALE